MNARRPFGFTLIELLVVISILGILAALTVPALKNLGKSNLETGATRQLLDDIGRARQLAINNHATVYMVFVPTNFTTLPAGDGGNYWSELNNINPQLERAKALTVATNLMAYQLSGYNFISHGQLGDQPGQHQWRYLSSWQSLPPGFIIDPQKFVWSYGHLISSSASPLYQSWNNDYPHADGNKIYSFTNITAVPFPTELSPAAVLPMIAFNYLGQLTFDGVNLAPRDEYIPLAQGSVDYARDPATKIPVLTTTAVSPDSISENPPGNSTNISYNIIHIDALTGRATLEFHKVQ